MAEELVGKMPVMVMSQDFLFANIYEGTKKNQANQRLKSNLLQFMLKKFDSNCKLDCGERLYSSDDLDALREKKIALLELLFEDGDFGFYSSGLSAFYEESARRYATVGNVEKTLDCLEKAAHLAIDFITFVQNGTFTHTSLFLKGMVETSSNVCLNGDQNQVEYILKNMEQIEYDIVRKTEKFKRIHDALEPYVKIKL